MKSVARIPFAAHPSVGSRAASALVAAVIIMIAVLVCSPVVAAPVTVRFQEGVVHGFLLVRSLAGEEIGQGEVTQVPREEGLVEGHLVIRLRDGSLHDEKVVYRQERLFTMISYHLIQRGPSFPKQIDASIDRSTTEYNVRFASGVDGREEVTTGRFKLPDDVYNGMFGIVLKNIKDSDQTVSYLVFTPEPQIIGVRVISNGEQALSIGERSSKARRYVLKPQIGMIRHWYGTLMGTLPAIFHYRWWMLADEVPGFVQFEGPLQLMAPVWRFGLVSPQLPTKSDEKTTPAKR
jgi:hypothetical protein